MKSLQFDYIDFHYSRYEDVKREEILYSDLQCGEELSEEKFADYLDAIEEPDLQDFIQHQRSEYDAAKEADAIDSRWLNLDACTDDAAIAVAEGNTARIAMAFYKLGMAVEEMQHPTREHLAEVDDLLIQRTNTDSRRHHKLELKAQKSRSVKQQVQEEAKALFDADSDEELRTGYVSQLLEDTACSLAGKNLTPAIIRKWVSEIAPEYAKKPGAPKKDKK